MENFEQSLIEFGINNHTYKFPSMIKGRFSTGDLVEEDGTSGVIMECFDIMGEYDHLVIKVVSSPH
jgi:hypothetical protein